MNKSVKIFFLSFVILLTFLISLTIVVDNKIRPSEIKSFVKKSLSQILPESKIEIGEIDYSMGTVVRIYINDISIDKKIVNVQKLTCKIPLFSILFGGSTIKVSIDNPIIDPKVQSAFSASLRKKNEVVFDVPSFIRKNKIDFKITDIQILKATEKIKFHKILLKDFSFKKSMAYEIEASVKTNIKGTIYHLDSQLIGEINLSHLNSNNNSSQVLKSNVHIDLRNISAQDTVIYPDMKGQLQVEFESINKILGVGKLNQNGTFDSQFEFIVKEDFIDLKNIQSMIQNNSFFKLLNNDFIEQVEANNSISTINGNISFNYVTNELEPDLQVQIKKPLIFNYRGMRIPTTANLDLRGQRVHAQLTQEFQSGIVTSDLDIKLNDQHNFQIIKGDVTLKNLVIDREFVSLIQNDMSKSADIREIEYSDEKHHTTVDLNILGENNLLGDAKVNFEANFKVNANRYHLSDIFFNSNVGKLSGDISFDKNNNYNVDISAQAIDLSDYQALLHPLSPKFLGVINGKLKGSGSPKNYDFKVDIKVDDFSFDLLDLSKPINDFLVKIGENKIFKDQERLNNFKYIQSRFQITSQRLQIFEANLLSEKISLKNIKADIPQNNKSVIEGYLIGNKRIPFKYIGKGNVLNPDINYTRKKNN